MTHFLDKKGRVSDGLPSEARNLVAHLNPIQIETRSLEQ